MQHVSLDGRSGWAALRKGAVADQRAGFDWDPSGNPQIVDLSGNVKLGVLATTGVVESTSVAVAGGSGSTGVFASVLNPWGVNVFIVSRQLRVSTQSSGAATVDIGVAADATTSNDGLIDGASVAAAGVVDVPGTNGKTGQFWGATQYVNVAEASGDVNGLVATLYIGAVRA